MDQDAALKKRVELVPRSPNWRKPRTSFGSSFRLSEVLTDPPFATTPRRDFGVDDFCMSCRVCEDACPPEVISPL